MGESDPLDTAEETIKENREHEDYASDMSEEEEEKSFLVPARWWYASTAFPLLAGTFGPMANAFSICALVENWRVKVPLGGTEEHGIDIPDPKWLIGVNAVSLVFALAANLALFLNMARRIPFKIAQPVSILGFWFASVLLIALIAVAAHDFHAPGVRDQALTQAYYYAIFAAGLYQIISYLMIVTVYGAYKGHFSKEFKLTLPQRTLMLQTMMFLTYLLLGALVYSKIEGWKFLDAVFWADFTLLTVGLGGDYVPRTHLGRGLLFPFAVGGIVFLGLVVGSIRSLVLERSKKKMSARMTEKARRRVLKRVQNANNKSGPVTKIKGLDKKTAGILTLDPHDDQDDEKRRREAEFTAMREVQDMSSRQQKWFSLTFSGLSWLILWFVGAAIFYVAETNQGWTYFESMYFAYVTLLTIGYGDFGPQSNSGKAFYVFWSLLAVPSLTILISNMGDTVIHMVKDLTIYLGEISVLPSDQGGVRESLRAGLQKATGGKIDFQKLRRGDDDIEEEAPGLARMPHRERKGNLPHNERDIEAVQKITSDFARAEELDEDEARKRGDTIAADIHHFRYILITEIRNVYADVSATTPKKYTYDEWSYYLRLLGEDEADSKFHRKAPVKVDTSEMTPATGESTTMAQEEAEPGNDQAGQKHAYTEKDERKEDEGPDSIRQWSWIGNRSPLMGDKDEPEWILEKLFERLESELMLEKKLAAKVRKKNKPSSASSQPDAMKPVRQADLRAPESASYHSSKTLEPDSDNSSRPASS